MKLLLLSLLFLYGAFAQLDTEWWKHTSIYQIIPATFKDGNGDGTGDIQGIISKLDHFVDLEIETLLLALDYTPPGYELYMNKEEKSFAINPLYGTLDDFAELLSETNKRGMKVVLDMELNHVTKNHDWFIKSENVIEPYTNYFIWEDPKMYSSSDWPVDPNNWLGWYYSDIREQFYYYQYSIQLPDLNLRHPEVKKEIKNILKFWLDLGVSGFKLSSCRYYMEDQYLRNNQPGRQDRTMDQPDSYEFIHELREFIDEYNKEQADGGIERILMTEARIKDITDLDMTKNYYDHDNISMAHLPLNYHLQDVTTYHDADTHEWYIRELLSILPDGATSNWLTEDYVYGRVGNKASEEFSDLMTITITTLPGSAVYYYGQEIGLSDGFTGYREKHHRLVMHWDNTINSGFSTNLETYMPAKSDFHKVNVKTQKKSSNSRYNMFKTLSTLRKTDTFKYGELSTYTFDSSAYLFALTRTYNLTGESYIVVLNFGPLLETVNLAEKIETLPATLEVVARSVNTENYEKGDAIVTADKISLRPMSGIVLLAKEEPNEDVK